MDVKQLVAQLKEQGVSDEEIKAQLEALRNDIDEILAPSQEQEQEETEDAKMNRVFGI